VLAAQWWAERRRVAEGAGLNTQGVGKILKIISVRRRSAPFRGFTPITQGERLASSIMQPGLS
jgi:signal recognition particle GTPase